MLGMRGGVGLVLSLIAVLLTGLAVSPAARGVTICLLSIQESGCVPRLIPEIRASIKPDELPRVDRAPIAVEVDGNIQSADPTGMPALREAVVGIDRQVTLNAEGLSSCRARQLVARGRREARRTCREAIVGSGTASVVFPPEWQEVEIPVTFFNGGVRDGTTTVFVHSTLAAPIPEVILVRVKVVELHVGEYGSQAVVRIPPIAGGSLRSFSFELQRRFSYEGEKRGYLAARCTERKLRSQVKLILRNEAETPQLAPTTELTGALFAPCRPTG